MGKREPYRQILRHQKPPPSSPNPAVQDQAPLPANRPKLLSNDRESEASAAPTSSDPSTSKGFLRMVNRSILASREDGLLARKQPISSRKSPGSQRWKQRPVPMAIQSRNWTI